MSLEFEEQETDLTNVLLVGVDLGDDPDFEHSMEELKSLAKACHKNVVGTVTQRMEMVNKGLYIGTGKVFEVKAVAEELGAEEVVFDNSLSPSQVRNLGRALDLKVIDRNNLILDIFALRAQTKEAKLQVETARLQYMLPRLVGMREALSRQGGTGGSMSNKGAGETKLELDRRKIEHRISELRKELNEISGNRMTQRKKRSESRIPQVSLVGYTNAGKSTILNRLVDRFGEGEEKNVLEKDMLFATLETHVRRIETGDNKPFLLADTVGFINKLPHNLVKAFRSTLEEVKYADLLLHVVDYSDENHKQHIKVTEDTLKELGASDIPQIIVYNKVDKTDMELFPWVSDNRIYMAAGIGEGIDELLELIKEKVYAGNKDVSFLFPYSMGGVASYFMDNATVLENEYREDGIFIKVNCTVQDAEKYKEYVVG